MTETGFAIIETITVFSFGIFISCAFAGIQYSKKNVWIMFFSSMICSIAVLLANFLPNRIISWLIMPALIHIPNLLLLFIYFHKRFSTSLAAICTTFLLCQPPRWIYTMLMRVIPNITILKICIFLGLFIITSLLAVYISQYISRLFSKETKSIYLRKYTNSLLCYKLLFRNRNKFLVNYRPYDYRIFPLLCVYHFLIILCGLLQGI